MLAADILELGRAYALDWFEFSCILEINRPLVALAELAARSPLKLNGFMSAISNTLVYQALPSSHRRPSRQTCLWTSATCSPRS